MPVIGQAFSPQFLALVLQKSEAQADRNLKAAIADRQNMVAIRQIRAERDIAAGKLGAAGKSSRAGIEAMKEEGRMKRASDANALKQALETQKLQLKGRAEDRLGGLADQRGGLLEAQTEQTMAETGILPSPEEAAATRDAKREKIASQTAKNREAIRMGQEKWATTRDYMEEQIKNLRSIRQDRKASSEMEKMEALVSSAMKVLRSQSDINNFVLRFEQWKNSVDKYGKPILEKAEDSPDLQATMQAMTDIVAGMRRTNKKVYDALVKKMPELRMLVEGGEPKPAPGLAPLPGGDMPGQALNDAAAQAGAAIPDFR